WPHRGSVASGRGCWPAEGALPDGDGGQMSDQRTRCDGHMRTWRSCPATPATEVTGALCTAISVLRKDGTVNQRGPELRRTPDNQLPGVSDAALCGRDWSRCREAFPGRSGELREQRPRLPQIARIESLGERVVDRRERTTCVLLLLLVVLPVQQTGEAG